MFDFDIGVRTGFSSCIHVMNSLADRFACFFPLEG
jgi:hypothetical protein